MENHGTSIQTLQMVRISNISKNIKIYLTYLGSLGQCCDTRIYKTIREKYGAQITGARCVSIASTLSPRCLPQGPVLVSGLRSGQLSGRILVTWLGVCGIVDRDLDAQRWSTSMRKRVHTHRYNIIYIYIILYIYYIQFVYYIHSIYFIYYVLFILHIVKNILYMYIYIIFIILHLIFIILYIL